VAHQTEEQGQLFQLSVLLNESMDRKKLNGSLELLTQDLSIYLIINELMN